MEFIKEDCIEIVSKFKAMKDSLSDDVHKSLNHLWISLLKRTVQKNQHT